MHLLWSDSYFLTRLLMNDSQFLQLTLSTYFRMLPHYLIKNCLQQPNFFGNYLWLKCIKNLLHLNYLSLLASRSDSSNVKMSPSRTGPFTLRMMDRFVSSRNSTRTWKVQQLSFIFHPGHFQGSKLICNKSKHNMLSS